MGVLLVYWMWCLCIGCAKCVECDVRVFDAWYVLDVFSVQCYHYGSV